MSTYQQSVGLRRLIGDDPSGLVRLALRLDAVASGALGLLALAAGPTLDALLGTPPAVLWPVGLFLVAYAAVLWVAASRSRVNLPFVGVVIAGNALWAVASVMIVAGGWWALTSLGVAVVLAQAVAVALFAELQFVGVRRARSAAA
jgi:hypothetical protein